MIISEKQIFRLMSFVNDFRALLLNLGHEEYLDCVYDINTYLHEIEKQQSEELKEIE